MQRMRHHALNLIAGAFALTTLAAPASAASLLVNGSFEDTPPLNNSTYGRGQLPTGWSTALGVETPDIVGSGYTQGSPPFLVLLTAQDGGKFLDMNGFTPTGALQQTVGGLAPGSALSLSFWSGSWAQNSSGLLRVSLLDASNSDVLATIDINVPFDNTKTVSSWGQYTIGGIAPSSGNVIVRMFGDSSAFDRGAPGLDNMVLTGTLTGAVPEPASWTMMIGGLGLAGGALRLRRRGAIRFA